MPLSGSYAGLVASFPITLLSTISLNQGLSWPSHACQKSCVWQHASLFNLKSCNICCHCVLDLMGQLAIDWFSIILMYCRRLGCFMIPWICLVGSSCNQSLCILTLSSTAVRRNDDPFTSFSFFTPLVQLPISWEGLMFAIPMLRQSTKCLFDQMILNRERPFLR